MSCETDSKCCLNARTAIYVAVIVATFLIMGGLVKLMIAYTQAPSTTATRAQERADNLKKYQEENSKLLNEYGYVDAAKGVVRIPITTAMELTIKEWQNAAAAKSNLVDRVEKATFVPPPPAPKPSIYE